MIRRIIPSLPTKKTIEPIAGAIKDIPKPLTNIEGSIIPPILCKESKAPIKPTICPSIPKINANKLIEDSKYVIFSEAVFLKTPFAVNPKTRNNMNTKE